MERVFVNVAKGEYTWNGNNFERGYCGYEFSSLGSAVMFARRLNKDNLIALGIPKELCAVDVEVVAKVDMTMIIKEVVLE